MKKLNLMKRFIKDDQGATTIEYALIVSLIFLAILGAVTLFAGNATIKFKAATDAITGSG